MAATRKIRFYNRKGDTAFTGDPDQYIASMQEIWAKYGKRESVEEIKVQMIEDAMAGSFAVGDMDNYRMLSQLVVVAEVKKDEAFKNVSDEEIIAEFNAVQASPYRRKLSARFFELDMASDIQYRLRAKHQSETPVVTVDATTSIAMKNN